MLAVRSKYRTQPSCAWTARGIWLRFRREETTAADLIAALTRRYELRDLTIEEPEIEAIIRDLYSAGQAIPPAATSPSTPESRSSLPE